MKTFAQPKTIASMLIEPPLIAPIVDVDTSVPMLDLPTMDLPGAPSGASGLTLGNTCLSYIVILVVKQFIGICKLD